MKIISQNMAFGGRQDVYSHQSSVCKCEMNFAVFVPPAAMNEPRPVLWYLSGLTCTHANAMEKRDYRRLASELGLIVVCPDTSPRGNGVPDEPTNWQMGKGAGMYVDATEMPWAEHYKMYSYVSKELPELIASAYRADMTRQGVLGHSMGGHGAMILALRNPSRFKSCSAFAPIVEPSTAEWTSKAFEKYLGSDKDVWRAYDACALVRDGARFPEFLIDQGTTDPLLEEGLRSRLFEEAAKGTGIEVTLRMQERYDHSHFFVSTFMHDHLRWHAERLG